MLRMWNELEKLISTDLYRAKGFHQLASYVEPSTNNITIMGKTTTSCYQVLTTQQNQLQKTKNQVARVIKSIYTYTDNSVLYVSVCSKIHEGSLICILACTYWQNLKILLFLLYLNKRKFSCYFHPNSKTLFYL